MGDAQPDRSRGKEFWLMAKARLSFLTHQERELIHSCSLEVLAGIVLAQLVNPGVPCIYGSSTSTFDMRCGTATVGAPEFGMLNAALAEMGHFYEVPVDAGGL